MTEALLRPVKIEEARLRAAFTATGDPAHEGYLNPRTGEIVFAGDGLEKVKADPSAWVKIPVHASNEAYYQAHVNSFLAGIGIRRA